VNDLRGKDRLIVALDVSSAADAMALVDNLDNVSFFKLGWQLFMTGVMTGDLKMVLELLVHKNVFVDLKVPGDIDNTVSAVVDFCIDLKNVKFLTLSEGMPLKTIAAASATRRAKNSENPKLLTVPLVSSLDATDLRDIAGDGVVMEQYVLARARAALGAGCDGVIASGDAIRLCRSSLPRETLIVSPGIRPTGSSTDDHKRHTTPTEAIRSGADYLVVGRPITRDPNPRSAAQRVIDEIDAALDPPRSSSGGKGNETTLFAMVAKAGH
jgi:orotidine-5'-phosphate decarboxylase